MQPTAPQNPTIVVTDLSNQAFLERYAQPGRLGLSGGLTFVDKAICRAERHLDARAQWGAWSHAFLFEGQRPDGHHWVIESDLQVHHKHIQLGVQENCVAKYYDDKLYTSLAVLDFGRDPTERGAALSAVLVTARERDVEDLVALRDELVQPDLEPRLSPTEEAGDVVGLPLGEGAAACRDADHQAFLPEAPT